MTSFTTLHPDWAEWADQIDWDVRYDCPATASGVMQVMLELGFTITPPPMRRYAITYNGHVITRMDSLAAAENFMAALRGSHAGYEIRDKGESACDNREPLTTPGSLRKIHAVLRAQAGHPQPEDVS